MPCCHPAVCRVGAYCGLALSENLVQVLIMMLPLTIASLVFSTVNTSQITKVSRVTAWRRAARS